MASDGLHESEHDLCQETRDNHRALTSLKEELDAIDWYRQRSEVCGEAELKAILLHNMREEMEHAAMLIEWLRRMDGDFAQYLHKYLFSDGAITTLEQASGLVPVTADLNTFTIGPLKEKST